MDHYLKSLTADEQNNGSGFERLLEHYAKEIFEKLQKWIDVCKIIENGLDDRLCEEAVI